MRVAYLVLAHDRPQQLRKLVDAIQAPWADILIHIDKKAKLAPFVDACAGAPVHFHEPRRKIHWSGWGVMQIQLDMLEAMRSPQYKYYKILSGRCYPTKSREQIREFLERNEASFMEYWTRDPVIKRNNAIDYPHFVDLIPIENFLRKQGFRTRPLYYLLRHPVQILYWGLFYALLYRDSPIKRLIPRRKRPMPVYGAEMWACLRHDFVEYLLDFLAERPDVLRYFKYARPADEYMIPSILYNSGFPIERKHLHINHEHLTGEHLERALGGANLLFARKFDEHSLARLESLQNAGNPVPTGSVHDANDARGSR